MEEKKLFIAWQDPVDRSWRPVGILSLRRDRMFRFVYTRGARASGSFVPFPGMEDLEQVYESEGLLPFFSNRLLSDSRPEYGRLLKWLNIQDAEPYSLLFNILAMTGGIRATDTFEVFECPVKNARGLYEAGFFIHGLRHVAKPAVERVNSLGRGQRLFLMLDEQNRDDAKAVALRADNPVELVGYCPWFLSRDLRQLLGHNRPMDVVVTVEQVNAEAPLNLRLLCKLVAPWLEGFQPCSDEDYAPLADYTYQIENEAMKSCQYGQRKEPVAAHQVRDYGTSVNKNPEKRRAADLKAVFPSGKSWNIRLKSFQTAEKEVPGTSARGFGGVPQSEKSPKNWGI
jgi:hypothetical protein